MTALVAVVPDSIICKMGQALSVLTVGHVAGGVARLVELLLDGPRFDQCHHWIEEFRSTAHPDPNTSWVHLLERRRFDDGILFELNLVCSNEEWRSVCWRLWMLWTTFRCCDPERATQRSSRVHALIKRHGYHALAKGDQNPGPYSGVFGRFDVDVLPARGLRPLGRSGGIALPRETCALLDAYAKPRLFLPSEGQGDELVGLEWLVQLVLRAAKAGVLEVKDEVVNLFWDYASRIGRGSFRKLEEAEQRVASDLVLQRLFQSHFGMGFLAPQSGMAFRSYVRKALAGAAKSFCAGRPLSSPPRSYKGLSRTRKGCAGLQEPRSIAEAAHAVGVDFSTVWRHLRRLGYASWAPEAWPKIQKAVEEKRLWKMIGSWLQAKGLGPEAARKRIQRWKKLGKTPRQVVYEVGLQKDQPAEP